MGYEKLKVAIIDDLEICIDYEPSKETDLICMMEQYLESEEKRDALLVEISHCISGKPYKNPFHIYYFYSKVDIEKIAEILKDYVFDMENEKNHYVTLSNTICKINEIHDKCMGELIDDWRKEKLEEFLLLVAESVEFYSALSIMTSEKRW